MNDRFKNYYMNIAQLTAELSRAKRLKVGCIIVKNDRIISHSWNGTPQGWNNECEDVIGVDENGNDILKTKPEVLHAERNALDKLAKDGDIGGKNASMFITHAPCLECAKSIYGAGIKEIFYKDEYRSTEGIDFLKKCNVHIQKIPSF